jgi:hypothetical protein
LSAPIHAINDQYLDINGGAGREEEGFGGVGDKPLASCTSASLTGFLRRFAMFAMFANVLLEAMGWRSTGDLEIMCLRVRNVLNIFCT